MELKYKSILFDMDGVIADTEPFHVGAEQQTCWDYGFEIDVDKWSGFKGRTAIDIFTYLVQTNGDPKKHTPEDLINHKTDVFIESLKGQLKPIDGVIEFLNWARDNHSEMSLVTSSNKKVQNFITESFGITDLFDEIVTGDDIEKGKPDPQPYLRALGKLGISGAGSIVIEDSKIGIISTQKAGCDVLAIATSHTVQELSGIEPIPTFIADDYFVARQHLSKR